MVGFTFTQKTDSPRYILQGWGKDIKVWGLILPFTPVLDIIFFANLQAWFRSPLIYPHIMCFGIYFIICISTTQSFPQGPNVCVAMRDTLPGIWCSLNKYCDNDEWRNTGITMNSSAQWWWIFCIRGPMTLLISSVTLIFLYTFYYKYMSLSSIEELLHVFKLHIFVRYHDAFYPFGSRFLSICHFHPWILPLVISWILSPWKGMLKFFYPLNL